jgi:hypothetical protein
MNFSNLLLKIGLLLYGYLIGHYSSKRYFKLKRSNIKLKLKDYLILLLSILIVIPGLIPIAGFLLGLFTNTSINRIEKGL